MWPPRRLVGENYGMLSCAICVLYLCRFHFWSVRDTMCVIVCVFSRMGFFTGGHDYEHVQANRMHVGRENNTF